MTDEPRRYRTIWISDLHLGTRDCKAAYALDFLRRCDADTLYLVGDLVDGWALARSWYWTQAHNDLLQKLLRKARKGTCILYIPGNHDAFARAYVGFNFGGIAVRARALHTTADRKQLLVIHGDEFDGAVRHAEWLSHVGARAYTLTLRLNRLVNRVRYRCGLPYWSLAAYLKGRAKRAVQYIARFEEAVADEARRAGVDGIVCGHIHAPEIRDIAGVMYLNCGDWVESCTALVEHFDGRLEILRWHTAGHEADAPSGDGVAAGVPVGAVAVGASLR